MIFLFIFVSLFVRSSSFQDYTDFIQRRDHVFEKIGNNIAIIYGEKLQTSPVKYRQSPDFYYLTGIEEPNSVLVLDGEKKTSTIFAFKVSEMGARMIDGSIWLDKDVKQSYGIDALKEFSQLMDFLKSNVKEKTIYLPLSPNDHVQGSRGEHGMMEKVQAMNPMINPVQNWQYAQNLINETFPENRKENIHKILDELRWLKTPYEIEKLRTSADIAVEGLIDAIKVSRVGSYEYELEAALTETYLKRGARGLAFTPIVASGPNIYTIHYTKNNRKIESGDIILLDSGADYDYYTSDVTRIWPVDGKLDSKIQTMYDCIVEVQTTLIKEIKPGKSLKDLKDIASKIYRKRGFENGFNMIGRYIGHAVGLSVHDVTPYDENKPLEPGVVWNLETVVEDHGQKLHLRLEDTIVITENSAEVLTKKLPYKIDELMRLK